VKRAPDVLQEEVGPDDDGQHQYDDRERHLDVHGQHHAERARKEHDVPEERNGEIGEEVPQALDVRLDPGHQFARGVLVEVREREPH